MATEFDQYKLRSRWNTTEYTHMFCSLLPRGLIWLCEGFTLPRVIQDVVSGYTWQDSLSSSDEVQDVIQETGSAGNLLRRILSTMASELVRFEDDGWRLINETDPGVSTDLLEDWERVLGLPESCFQDQALSIEERQRQAHAKLFDTYKTTTEQFYVDYAETLGFVVTVTELPSATTPRRLGVARMGVERMGGRGGYSILEVTVISGTSDQDLLECAFAKVKQAHVIIVYV